MITHPEKVLFPDVGITKGELASYYEAVAPIMVPHIRARPITMERFPAGIGQKGFLQKDLSKGFPAWLKRIEVPKKGGTVHHPIVPDTRSLLWLVNQNSITPHVWTSCGGRSSSSRTSVCLISTRRRTILTCCARSRALRDLLKEPRPSELREDVRIEGPSTSSCRSMARHDSAKWHDLPTPWGASSWSAIRNISPRNSARLTAAVAFSSTPAGMRTARRLRRSTPSVPNPARPFPRHVRGTRSSPAKSARAPLR